MGLFPEIDIPCIPKFVILNLIVVVKSFDMYPLYVRIEEYLSANFCGMIEVSTTSYSSKPPILLGRLINRYSDFDND